MQMDAMLTLEKAKKAVRQREAVQESKSLWRSNSSSDPITGHTKKKNKAI